jgi:Mg2+/Co2+ transporter CorC
VPESRSAINLFRETQAKRIHFAFAVDEHGGTAGTVMPEDPLEGMQIVWTPWFRRAGTTSWLARDRPGE